MGDTPVPIPNTMVKTQAADGTALETVWESRWLPDFLFGNDRSNSVEIKFHINTDMSEWTGDDHPLCDEGHENPVSREVLF